MPQGLKIKYEVAWGTFEKVRGYNINISTLNGERGTTDPYWQFSTYDDQANWTLGLALHTKRYPNIKWNLPEHP